jgi:hypothetical protein
MEPITSHSQAGTIQDMALDGETCRKLDPLIFNQATGILSLAASSSSFSYDIFSLHLETIISPAEAGPVAE